MPAIASANLRIYRQSLRLAEKELAARRAAAAAQVAGPLPRQSLPPHALEMAWGAAVRIVE